MKAGIVISLILLAALIGTNGWWAYRAFTACNVFPYHDTASADGRHTVLLLYNNCGATTPFSTRAVMQSPQQRFQPRDYKPFLIVHGLHDLKVRWLDDARVEILLPRGEEVYRRDEKVDGVTMLYRSEP